MITIRVAKDFSSTPGGRFKEMGPKSGEEFREIIEKYLSSGEHVTVILDDVEGYGSSFLDEAFGGLLRIGRWKKDDLQRRLIIRAEKSAFKTYEIEAKRYLSGQV